MGDELKVTQADCERAAECFDFIDLDEQADAIERVAPIFARHRIAAETQSQATIDELVGALRALDNFWLEDGWAPPEPDPAQQGPRILSPETLDIWRKIRAAIAKAGGQS